MCIRLVMVAVVLQLFACQAGEKTGEVKSSGFGEGNRKKFDLDAALDDFKKCMYAVAKNQNDTLRETHNDPTCALTEANNVNACAEFASEKRRASSSGVLQYDLVDHEDTGIYQRFVFSDIKACKCMQTNGMTLGVTGSTSTVRVGLGSFAKHAPSDRFTFDDVDQVHIQLLPDHPNIKPPTYHYCRLEIIGYDNINGYKLKMPKKDNDGNLVPEGLQPDGGFRTADGDMHDRVTPLPTSRP